MMEKSYGIIPVVKKGNEFLYLFVHSNAGHWGFPKGHAEQGETEVETALRECMEESGISQIALVKNAIFTCSYPVKKDGGEVMKEVKLFLASATDENVIQNFKPSDEIKECRWLTFTEAEKLATYEGTKTVLRDTEAYLRAYSQSNV